MTDQEALRAIRDAIGCPEWVDADRTVGLVRDIAESIEHSFELSCLVLGPNNEQFMICPMLTRCKEIESDLELDSAEYLAVNSAEAVRGGTES